MNEDHARRVAEIEALFATYYPNVPKVISAQSLEALDTLAAEDTLKRMRASWQTLVTAMADALMPPKFNWVLTAAKVQIDEKRRSLAPPRVSSMEIVHQAIIKIGENDV